MGPSVGERAESIAKLASNSNSRKPFIPPILDVFPSKGQGGDTFPCLSMDPNIVNTPAMYPLNLVAILVAAIAAFFIGFMWHGPVFGKMWMKLMKISKADMAKGQKEMAGKMHYYMITAFIQQLVTATALSIICIVCGVSDATGAIVLAILLWLGLIATTLLNGVLWEKRSIPLYLFNIAYHLVNIVVITLIVGLWR